MVRNLSAIAFVSNVMDAPPWLISSQRPSPCLATSHAECQANPDFTLALDTANQATVTNAGKTSLHVKSKPQHLCHQIAFSICFQPQLSVSAQFTALRKVCFS